MKAVIGAVHDLDHAPIDRADLRSIETELNLPRVGESHVWLEASVGLFAAEMAFSQGATRSRKAFASDRTVHVVLDGTITNRRTLLDDLHCALKPDEVSSAEVVLLAYHAWSSCCAERLLGHFSFVLWDSSIRRLLAVRDPLGVNELFYRNEGRRLQLGTRLSQLVNDQALSGCDLDEEYIADFLASQVTVGPRTPLRGIQRLCSGHYLLAEGGIVSTACYWDLDDSPSTDCNGPGEHAERFRELFEDSVRASLSTQGRVCAELSGGLDSSAITVMARHVLEKTPDLSPPLSTLTVTFPENPESDETAWAKLLLSELDIPSHWLPCDDSFFDDAELAARLRNEPHFGILCLPMHRREAHCLASAGVEVLLSGSRAESVILDDIPPIHLSDQLRHLALGKLVGDLRAWQSATAESFLNLFVWCCLRPLLRPGTFEFSSEQRHFVQPWIQPDYAKRMDLPSRARLNRTPRKFASAAIQHQYERIKRSEQMIHRGLLEWSVEIRYPFLHRPLVEFCFAAPWEIKHRPGSHKNLLRAGLAGILPEAVRRRMSSSSPTAAAFRAFARRWAALQGIGQTSILADLGIFDAREWERALLLARHGYSENFVALTSCIAFEYWLRARMGSVRRRKNGIGDQ